MATAHLLPVQTRAAIAPAWAGPRPAPAATGPRLPDAPWLAAAETSLALVLLALALVAAQPVGAVITGGMPLGSAATRGLPPLPLGLDDVLRLAVLAVAWPLAGHLAGLYHEAGTSAPARERRRVIAASAAVTAVALGAPALVGDGRPSSTLLWFWPGVTLGLLGLREMRRAVAATHAPVRRVLIVGSGPRAAMVAAQLGDTTPARCEIAGFVDVPGAEPATPEIARRLVGRPDELDTLLMHEAIDEVFITLPVQSCYAAIRQAILACERVGVRVTYRVDLVDTALARPESTAPVGPVVTMHMVPHDSRLVIKRAIDVLGASAGLIVLAPVLAVAALAIRLTSPGPIVFAQERYGLNRRRFRMFKFRTMVPDAERLQAGLETRNEAQGPVFKLAADPRITPVGRWLRRTSIDELPQLLNVLRGEMSLVGPRPLPLRDVRRFTSAGDMRRFSVRPGLTCLWQIGGRSTVGFAEWVRLDLAYIDGWSLGLDLRILLRTVPAVLRGTGAH